MSYRDDRDWLPQESTYNKSDDHLSVSTLCKNVLVKTKKSDIKETDNVFKSDEHLDNGRDNSG